VKTFVYNAGGDLTSVSGFTSTYGYGYDPLGRQISSTSPDGQVTTYTYDALDRITSVTLPKPVANSPLNFVTTYAYNNYDSASGLVFTNVTDANGRVTKSGYDALGHLVQTVDAAGNVTTFTYQNNLLKKITDANGNATTYSYDVNRNLSGTSFPDGSSESYVIGVDGLLHSKTDRKGQPFTYSYDNLGRLGSVGFYTSTGAWIGQIYTYAGASYQGTNMGQNLAAINDSSTAGTTSYQFTYDSSFRRTVQSISLGETTTFSYSDPFGWAGSQISGYTIAPGTGQSGTTQSVTFGYNPDGMMTSETWSWIPNGPFIFAYTPNGQYSGITLPNGQQRRFTYDNQGRLTNINNTSPGGDTIASFDYAYDYDWQAATYSILGQRTSVNVTAPGASNIVNGLTKYSYDSRYQLVRTDYPNSTYEAWTYDAIGNRLSRRTYWGSLFPYAYYQNASGGNTQRLRNDSISTYDFTYDAAGNVTGANGVPNYYTWDYANRLTSFSGKTYAYDLFGRTSTTANGSTTRYVGLSGNTVGERNTTTGVATDYVFGPGIDEPLAKRTANGSITYFGVDGLGSVVVSTDPTGAVQSSTGYSPWGETATMPPELFGYTGRETGGPSWYYRARYYDAVRGRFLSEDPVKHKSGDLNFYRYVSNLPTKYIDPMGLAVSEPRSVPCTNCSPVIQQGARDALRHICDSTRTNGRCASVLRRYGRYDCLRDRCGRAGGGEGSIPVVCVEGGCGGCGGPCNALSDPRQAIFLQPLAGSALCGSLSNTVAHELAHMCGVGPDVGSDPGRQENQREANAIADACGGLQ
jgi:RHS repeat-associated protein